MAFDFLDVAFDWKNDRTVGGSPPTDPTSPCVMRFGFGGDQTPNTEDPATIQVGGGFRFTFFETSKSHGVKLPEVSITITKSDGSPGSPFSGFSGGTLNFDYDGDKNGMSGPLNTQGTGWGTSVYTVANEGSYLITVAIQATNDGKHFRYWKVDPELIVGPKKGG